MLYALFFVLIGMFIGWNVKQPPWVKELQDKVVGAIRSILGSGSGGHGRGPGA